MVDLEHMFSGMPGTLTPSMFNRANSCYPTTDVVETRDSYELQAEVPGFDKKNIQVEVPDSHTIVLRGAMLQEYQMESPFTTSSDKQEGQASDSCQWWIQERVTGSFLRSFHLPINIDPQSIKASCVSGVLKVTIPNTESMRSASIDID